MIHWSWKGNNFELEIHYFLRKALAIYQPVGHPFQFHTYEIEDYPVFPSTDEEVDKFINENFVKIL